MYRVFYIFSALLLLSACQSKDIPPPPEGMTLIEGGKGVIGANEGPLHEQPRFTLHVHSYYIDKSPVTVAEFRQFVKETGYVTQAKKFGNSAVYNFETSQWELIDSATWQYPLGPTGPPAQDDHPVTHVSWNDANAYAEWAGKRLPSEVEWEFAARKGIPEDWRYTWGTELLDDQGYRANVWQGTFPGKNLELDGFLLTSPVGYFGENSHGMTDVGGNVWEWCMDTYRPYENSPAKIKVDEEVKVMRGGSFMCDSTFCHGYRVTHRNSTTSESSFFHTGFRCVKDIKN